MKFVLFSLLVAAAAGCTRPNPWSCLADNHCSDPQFPFCDADGSIEGEPGQCVAVACAAGEFKACQGERVVKCDARGTNYEFVECEFGCSEEARGCKACDTVECEKRIIPKYLPDICESLSSVEAPMVINVTKMINTSNEGECDRIVPQASGPELCVIHRRSVTVDANRTLTLFGARALAIVADYGVTINGTVDLRGGPGVVVGAVGSNLLHIGGGGAGFATAGGAGGSSTADGGGMNGGASSPPPASLTALIGGRSTEQFLAQGGGAVTLISCRGSVSVDGIIDANGGGGRPAGEIAFSIPPTNGPASGGASGGTIVLQGMEVFITGELYANGGGGGSGIRDLVGSNGRVGADGQRSASPAQGGTDPLSYGGAGGNGGTDVPPTAGRKPLLSSGTPGAGGGSAGFLQIYTRSGTTPSLTPRAVSPSFRPHETLLTR